MYRPPAGDPNTSVEVVDRWLVRASRSLMSTWDPEAGNFWRDSWEALADIADDEVDGEGTFGRGKGATSNNRSYQALVSAAHFFSEYSIGEPPQLKEELIEAVAQMTTRYFTRNLDAVRGHGENKVNPFTDAQLLLSLCLALSPVTVRTCGFALTGQQVETLTSHLVELAGVVAEQLGPDGVPVHKKARPHHFLTLHTIRALDAAHNALVGLGIDPAPFRVAIEQRNDYTDLVTRVREEILQQLGLHLLPAPGFDSSSLTSCCALLGRLTGDADSPLIRHAVDALDADQSERGTWTSAGVISFGRRRMVYIPSVEMSLALCNLAHLDLYTGDSDIFERSAAALAASLRLTQSSFSRHHGKFGWGNDRTRSGSEIESWTTAVVVRFLISYRQVLSLSRQEQILQKYRADRRPAGFETFWPDLRPLIPDVERQKILRTDQLPEHRLQRFSTITDPTPGNAVVEGVRNEILEPTLRSVSERPVDTASFLLYGPPGTRKTSFVSAMARELGWPLVTLSPPNFLRNGIEGFEATADEIFEDLFHLERVVVLFEECEEFFRWRPPDTAIESRTVGAFITSGMLPRLQQLRETRWIVFVINTNAEAFELDDAVTRRGRLDKVARIGHPSLESQMRYLGRWHSRPAGRQLSAEQLEWFRTHLEEVEDEVRPVRKQFEDERKMVQRANPDRGQAYRDGMEQLHREEAKHMTKLVTFPLLDNLASRCVGEGNRSPIASSDQLMNNLQQEFDRFGPDSWIYETP